MARLLLFRFESLCKFRFSRGTRLLAKGKRRQSNCSDIVVENAKRPCEIAIDLFRVKGNTVDRFESLSSLYYNCNKYM